MLLLLLKKNFSKRKKKWYNYPKPKVTVAILNKLFFKAIYKLAIGGSKVVQHSNHNPKAEGLYPAVAVV